MRCWIVGLDEELRSIFGDVGEDIAPWQDLELLVKSARSGRENFPQRYGAVQADVADVDQVVSVVSDCYERAAVQDLATPEICESRYIRVDRSP